MGRARVNRARLFREITAPLDNLVIRALSRDWACSNCDSCPGTFYGATVLDPCLRHFRKHIFRAAAQAHVYGPGRQNKSFGFAD